jgi:IPT/TIG domain
MPDSAEEFGLNTVTRPLLAAGRDSLQENDIRMTPRPGSQANVRRTEYPTPESVMRPLNLLPILLVTLALAGCGAERQMSQPGPPSGSQAAPSISAIAPNSAPAGSTGFTMTVNGSNFGSDSVVYWNFSNRKTQFVSTNQIVCAIDDKDLEDPGTFGIYVRSGGQNSNTVPFIVQ